VPATREGVTACLLDVYDTILASHFPGRLAALAGLADVPVEQFGAQWLTLARERDNGKLPMAAAFARALAECGRDPDPGLVDRLVQADAELILTHTEVCADTVPFLDAIRQEGIRVALVSNCADNTRPMLAAKGLLDLADAVVLSCEIGIAKPDPEIYLIALQELGAQSADAVMLDDQPRFCAGAQAAGVRAIQVVRPAIASHPADPRFSSVTSLRDALPLMLLSPFETGPPSVAAGPTEQGRDRRAGRPRCCGRLDGMTTSGSSARHVVIVGGGIAGLAAAFALRDAMADGAPVRVTVVEGSPWLGGKLSASEVAGVSMDEGAEALLARRPEGIDLITASGGGDLVPAGTTSSAIWTRGAMRALPRRQFMGVPADIDELAAAGVVSAAGIARARREERVERNGDISVTDYVGGVLGAEVVDRLVDPLLGGVYAGRSEELSFDATLAPLAAAARKHPVLTEAAASLTPPRPADPSAKAAPVFVTLTTGLGSLPATIAKASGADIRTSAMVRQLARTETGWRLTIGSAADPEYLEADAVILACPAAPAARLLMTTAPAASAALSEIPYASMAIITLAYRAADFPATGRSGYLVPAVDGKAVKAATFSTVKWPHLAQAAADAGSAFHIIRCSVGRIGEVALLQRDDQDLVSLAAAELAEATGVSGAPVESRVTRWGGGLPQYNVGHLDRVARIRAAVAAQPGLAVAGAAYDGVGIPACIATARQAAGQVLAGLHGSKAEP
jgi:oxygen-dependent protoporphyrinogen oxidase